MIGNETSPFEIHVSVVFYYESFSYVKGSSSWFLAECGYSWVACTIFSAVVERVVAGYDREICRYFFFRHFGFLDADDIAACLLQHIFKVSVSKHHRLEPRYVPGRDFHKYKGPL